jgi:hypothetical protein
MVKMMGSLVAAIEVRKYPTFFYGCLPMTNITKLASSFVVETTMSKV